MAKEQPAEPSKPRETMPEFLSSMASVLIMGLFILTFVVQAFGIPTSSMENTLLVGDHLFVNRVQFAPQTKWLGPLLPYRQLQRGDVAVFLKPGEPGLFLVKRIIGVPGDRIHLQDGVVYRNGEKLVEPYVIHSLGDDNAYRDNFPQVSASELTGATPDWSLDLARHIDHGDLVVPPNRYFGMGDNRDVSNDSRFWGFIPQENVIGRPLFIYWSFETPEGEYLKTEMSQRLEIFAHVVIHFFDETRWRRSLNMVR
jgi:signal peptidase I